MTLSFEIFPADLDATADFYTRVLRFALVRDERQASSPYLSFARGDVRLGATPAAAVAAGPADAAARRPPTGVELVLEVDDVAAERDRVVTTGWPMDEDLQDRPWGLRDFRILDPSGYYLRVTNRAG